MRTFLLLILLLSLPSCVVRPGVVHTSGGGYVAFMGAVFAAKVGPTVAQITTKDGDVIKFASESEDGTDVPLGYIAGDVTKTLSGNTAGVANHAATTKSQTTLGLGAQSVEKARIKSAEKVTLGTFVKPEQ